MSQNFYDTVILGATFLGIGAALNLQNAVVIEKSGLIGEEFVNSYKVCPPKVVKVQTKLGERFFDELNGRGLIEVNGEIYPAPTIYVLSKFLKEASVDVFLMTEVIRVKKVDRKYYLTVYHSGGFETIVAKRIIDTTSLSLRCEGAVQRQMSVKKTLNCIIYNPENRLLEGLSFNRMNGVYIYALQVDINVERYEAVKALYDMGNVFKENNMRISGIASSFAYELENIVEVFGNSPESFEWYPSVICANLLEAFDRGVEIAGGEKA